MEQRPLWWALTLDGVMVFWPLVSLFLAGSLEVVFPVGWQVLLFLAMLAGGVIAGSIGTVVLAMWRRVEMSRETSVNLIYLSGLILFGTWFSLGITLGIRNWATTGCDPYYGASNCVLAQGFGYIYLALLPLPIAPIVTIAWVLLGSLVSFIHRHSRASQTTQITPGPVVPNDLADRL